MGISDLRDLAVIEDVSYSDLEAGIVAVDFNNWIYRYLTVLVRYTDEGVYTTKDGTDVLNLLGIIKGVPKFFEHGLYPVFVFDGDVLELKEDEMDRRRERTEAAAEELEGAKERGDLERIRSLQAQSQHLTATHIETSRELLELLDIPIVDAPAEAEAQAAHLAREGAVKYVGSEDYDTLLFGAPVTLRKLTSSGAVERMDLEATLNTHGISREQLIDIAILCGTDYNDGVHGVGPKTALKAIRDGDSVEAVLDRYDATIPHLEEIRDIFRSPTVTTDVTVDMHSEPDFDAVEAYLTDDWGIPHSSLERALERTRSSMTSFDYPTISEE